MVAVLVLECDGQDRGVMRDLLTAADVHEVTMVTTDHEALDRLSSRAGGAVVVCNTAHAGYHTSTVFFAAVAADARLTARHRYLLLSSSQAVMPEVLRRFLHRVNAAILPASLSAESVLTYVREAAQQLAPANAPATPSQMHQSPTVS